MINHYPLIIMIDHSPPITMIDLYDWSLSFNNYD